MKLNKTLKLMIAGGGCLGLTLWTTSVVSCSIADNPKDTISNPNTQNQSLNQKINPAIYNQSSSNNAILQDAKQKANNSNTSVYYIGWGAVFHKFFVLTHLYNTLQLNPNKNIIVYCMDNFYDIPSDFKQKFPNVEFRTAKVFADWIIKNNANISYFEQFKELVNMSNYDLYIDDMSIFQPIYTMANNNFTLANIDWNILLNDYLSFLYKANSINIISDGTIAYFYYSNLFYEIFLLLNCKVIDNEFLNATKAYNYFKQMIDTNQKIDFNNDFKKVFYFYLSPFITNKKSNDFTRSKLFLASSQLVVEVNSPDTPILDCNEDSWFDPYNSLSSNLLESFNNIKQEYKDVIFTLLKVPSFNKTDIEAKLAGYDNYIYSMRKLENPDIIENEAKKIIYLYNNCIDKTKKFQIVLKGHPREDKDVITILNNEIKRLDPSINTTGLLTTLDFKIPYEVYLIEGIFTNHSNYTVKLFQTYSTIALFVYDYNKTANQKITIQNFLLSKKENDDINYSFGENSLLFDNKLRIIF